MQFLLVWIQEGDVWLWVFFLNFCHKNHCFIIYPNTPLRSCRQWGLLIKHPFGCSQIGVLKFNFVKKIFFTSIKLFYPDIDINFIYSVCFRHLEKLIHYTHLTSYPSIWVFKISFGYFKIIIFKK